MLSLLTASFLAVGLVFFIGGLIEVGTALRLLRARRAQGAGRGWTQVDAIVVASAGALTSPFTHQRCVMFTLVLLRRRLHESLGAGALFFTEQVPFFVVTPDGNSIAVDQKKQKVFMLGLPVLDRPLPFLPNTIAGLLVQRFGRYGHLWAEEHVVRVQQTTLDDGAAVHALCADGVVVLLSTTPLRTLGRAALARGAAAVAAGLMNFLFFWWLH